MTEEGCTDQFNDSPASSTCYLSGGETYTTNPSGTTEDDYLVHVQYNSNEYTCSFWAKCQYLTAQWAVRERQVVIRDVHYLKADDLVNCNGELKEDSC